uniref:Glycosyl hydrolase family 13 catalytic domain-containing protein n=1 Tax=Trichobilharzia regenti TaxID=157069 RepID=A0AA85K5A8_TRIRE|nr:unnamed protein product [Trichobilharzia regenti]
MNDFVVYLDDPKQQQQQQQQQLQAKTDQTPTNNSNGQEKSAEKNSTSNNIDNNSKSGNPLENKTLLETNESDEANQGEKYRLLTSEDLIQLDENSPKWKRIRIGLLIAFWIIWFGLLIGTIVYVIVGPKCATIPKLPFWKSTVGYWVDVFAFKDTTGDLVGDLNGFISEAEYIKNVIGAGYVILGPITKGFYNNRHKIFGLVEDYDAVDETLGTMDDFRRLIKRFHKLGIKVILTFNFNGISVEHKWIAEKKAKLTKLPSNFGKGYSRYGQELGVDIENEKYYSVFGWPSVDLDLTDSSTQKAIFDSIGHWMREGIDGILLDNCAFFNEIMESTEGTRTTKNAWFSGYPNRQLFVNTSVNFVGQVKKEIDSWSQKTGKEKLLAVSAGDVGYGTMDGPDSMLMFRDVADLIMNREFVTNKGWKTGNPRNNLNLTNYLSYTNDDMMRSGLSTANPSEPLSWNLLDLAATFLLPGSPVVYYGTELGIANSHLRYRPDSFYPKDRQLYLSPNDVSLLAHLPMPWNSNGKMFSEAINDTSFADHLRNYQITNTVESYLAEGHGESVLSFINNLVALYTSSSLKWATVEPIPYPPQYSQAIFGLFARKAKDFPTLIVAIMKPLTSEYVILDFTSMCSTLTPRIVFPSNGYLLVNTTLPSAKIYVGEYVTSGQIFVFQCN